MTQQKLIAGNWKMNGNRAEWKKLATEVMAGAKTVGADVLICPPAAGLAEVADTLAGQDILIGAQDISAYEDGAHTGEISAAMVKDFDCTHAIVGHSERRYFQQESNEMIAGKARQAMLHGLCPVVCVGETEAQKEAGETMNVLDGQLLGSLNGVQIADPTCLVIAYEPVWAIGTGRVPTTDDVKEAFAFIRKKVVSLYGEKGNSIKLLYGGSVKPDNAAELLTIENVDGALVGGASLKAESFIGIAKALES